MKLAIDSNILISSLDSKDIFHTECYPIFKRILDFEIEALCPTLVLVETTCVLRRRTNELIAIAAYKHLSRLPSINWLDMTLEVSQRACILGVKTGLRGGDALVLQVAEQYGIPLLTKDKEIKEKAPKGLFVLEPTDIPL